MVSTPEFVNPKRRMPETEDFPSGPDVGERLPEIILRDQFGEWVNVEQKRGNRRALIVFYRSLDW